MEFMQELVSNHILKVSFWAWTIAQVLKVPFNILHYGKLDLGRLIGSGGMPSSHSALVVAMATGVGRDLGVGSPAFAMAVVFAVVVMYDAAGVRRAAGKQAEAINQIINDIYHGTQISQERLKELIGHTPFEVMIGALIGLLMGLFL